MEKKQPKLTPKEIKNRIRILKVMPYEGHMVYLRLIGEELFEWLLVFDGEIYAGSMVFVLPKGKKEMTQEQINVASNLVWAGATATLDMKMGKKLTKEQEEKAQLFEALDQSSQAN